MGRPGHHAPRFGELSFDGPLGTSTLCLCFRKPGRARAGLTEKARDPGRVLFSSQGLSQLTAWEPSHGAANCWGGWDAIAALAIFQESHGF